RHHRRGPFRVEPSVMLAIACTLRPLGRSTRSGPRERREFTMKVGTLELDHVRGFGDKVFGLTKEFIGTIAGSDRLQEEGEAQQARGTESLKALRKQAKAQAKE